MKPLALLRVTPRAREILTILVRYGFNDLLTQLNVPPGLVRVVTPREVATMTTWQRIRHAAEELGPTFVKIGQILSTRPDMVPAPLIAELQNLRDQVKPEPTADVLAVLDSQLDGSVADHFDEFGEQPLGSGSIAQVHKARLKGSGEWVAVKIQRPGIERAIYADLEILAWMARGVHDRVPALRPYNLPDVVEVLREGLRLELDFNHEARNAELFNARNPYPEHVFAPRVLPRFTSRRLLVTELVEGVSPSRAGLMPEQAAAIARNGGNSVFHQIIRIGFFHADPHPGNILITPSGRLCLIDWGLAGQLTRKMRYRLADLLEAVMRHEPERVARIAVSMNRDNRLIDEQRLEMQVTNVLDRFGAEVDVGDIGHIFVDLVYVFGQNGVRLSRDYTLLARAVVTIEHTGRQLDPAFDIGAIARPFLDELAWERWRPAAVVRQVAWALQNGLLKLNDLPADLQRLLRRIESEDLGINLHHRGLEPFGDDLQRSANRLSVAVILGASIIGSSIVITTGIHPLLWGYPAIGIVGFVFSGFMGMWVVFDIIRHGRHK